jgi:hypothetical protein
MPMYGYTSGIMLRIFKDLSFTNLDSLLMNDNVDNLEFYSYEPMLLDVSYSASLFMYDLLDDLEFDLDTSKSMSLSILPSPCMFCYQG